MSKAARDDQGKATTEPQSRACEGTNSREPGENQSPRGARRPQRIETEDLGLVNSSSMDAERRSLMKLTSQMERNLLIFFVGQSRTTLVCSTVLFMVAILSVIFIMIVYY